MTKNLLNIADLRVDYPAPGGDLAPALQLPLLTLAKGQMMAVCGPSGCGKTTLGRALLGMLPADGRVAGSIRFDGQELTDLEESGWRALRGRRITGISQDATAALNPVLRIGRQFRQVGLKPDQAAQALSQLGLTGDRDWLRASPHQLSGGQCQRVALGLALACEPALLIADEPTAALDRQTGLEVLSLLQTLAAERHMAVLLITHDRPMVSQLGLALTALTAPISLDHATPVASAPSAPLPPAARPGPDSQPGAAPLLQVDRLTVHYPGVDRSLPALDQISLSLGTQSTLAVVGPSGSGKSTLAKAVMGLLTPDSGRVLLRGRPLPARWTRQRLPMQLVLQDTLSSLNPRHRVAQMMAESLHQGQRSADPGLDPGVDLGSSSPQQCLEEVGLDASFLSRYPHELSGGQRQRIALARALALAPQLIVLDEALSALDIPVREALLAVLLEIQQRRGISYLMITHDLDRLEKIPHTVLALDNGRVSGPAPQELAVSS